jgi:hypothetical protein
MWVIGESRLFNVGSKYYTLCPYRAARAAADQFRFRLSSRSSCSLYGY